MKIVIATGGTAGHIFPAVETARALQIKGHAVIFVAPEQKGAAQLRAQGFECYPINCRGLSGHGISLFWSCVLMLRGFCQSFRILKRIRPDVVCGFGGYGAFPVVLAACRMKFPTLIHEQNVIPGRANAFLSARVNKIAVSFEESRPYLNNQNGKIIRTGCPSHFSNAGLNAEEIFQKFGFEKGRKTILVFGGSQGSRRINQVFLETLPMLKGDLHCQVIHITGAKDYPEVKRRYNSFGIPFALFEFCDKIEDAYAIADLVIARAGAVTVTEIGLFQKKAILIPYPYAGAHQKANAEVLVKQGKAVCLEEKDLTAGRLKWEILKSLAWPDEAPKGKLCYSTRCLPTADRKLAEEIEKLVVS